MASFMVIHFNSVSSALITISFCKSHASCAGAHLISRSIRIPSGEESTKAPIHSKSPRIDSLKTSASTGGKYEV